MTDNSDVQYKQAVRDGVSRRGEDLRKGLLQMLRALEVETSHEVRPATADARVLTLQKKKHEVQQHDFSFLRNNPGSCDDGSCGDGDVMPATLIECCGLYEGELLFGDPLIAAVGKFLADDQKCGSSPASLGHAASLYAPGTVAPGTTGALFTVVVTTFDKSGRVTHDDDDDDDDEARRSPAQSQYHYRRARWVESNACEQKKFEMFRALDAEIAKLVENTSAAAETREPATNTENAE